MQLIFWFIFVFGTAGGEFFIDIENYMQNKLNIISLKIKEDTYNDKDCYVILFGNTRELWIDKKIMLPVREVQKNNGEINFERTFLIETNIVSDNDIFPPDSEN